MADEERTGFIGRYKTVLAIFLLLVGEAVVLLLLVGGRETSYGDPRELAAPGIGTVEVQLGDFKVTNVFQPDRPVRIDCSVVAAVDENRADDFEEIRLQRQERIKDAVSVVLRKASPDEIHESNLFSIKRKIREAVMEVVGRETQFIQDEQGILIPEFKPFEG